MATDLTVLAQQVINSISQSDSNGFITSLTNVITALTNPVQNSAVTGSIIDGMNKEIECLQADVKRLTKNIMGAITITSEQVFETFTAVLESTSDVAEYITGFDENISDSTGKLIIGSSSGWYAKMTYSDPTIGKRVSLAIHEGYTRLGVVFSTDGANTVNLSDFEIDVWLNVGPVDSSGDFTVGLTFIQNNLDATGGTLPIKFPNGTAFTTEIRALTPGPLPDLTQAPSSYSIVNRVVPDVMKESVQVINGAKPTPKSQFISCVQAVANLAVPTNPSPPVANKSIWSYIQSFGTLVVNNLPEIITVAAGIFGL